MRVLMIWPHWSYVSVDVKVCVQFGCLAAVNVRQRSVRVGRAICSFASLSERRFSVLIAVHVDLPLFCANYLSRWNRREKPISVKVPGQSAANRSNNRARGTAESYPPSRCVSLAVASAGLLCQTDLFSSTLDVQFYRSEIQDRG